MTNKIKQERQKLYEQYTGLISKSNNLKLLIQELNLRALSRENTILTRKLPEQEADKTLINTLNSSLNRSIQAIEVQIKQINKQIKELEEKIDS